MINYEWRINEIDEHGDIIDINFYDVTVKGTKQMLDDYKKDERFNDIELTIDSYVSAKGYATLLHDDLCFEDSHASNGYKIPKRILTMLGNFKES